MWDGLEFFGFDLKKIPRLYGKKVRWYDKFSDMESTPILLMMVILFIYITTIELDKIVHAHIKSQTIQLSENTEYFYNVTDSIPLMATSLYYVNEIFPKVRAHQRRHWDSKTDFQHAKKKYLPEKYEDWDWADNEYFEKIMCDHHQMYY